MAIGSIKNPYLQQVLFQNLSSSTIQPNQLKDSAQLLNSAMTARNSNATISAAGNKINNVSKTIRNGGDMQAYEGFQTAIQRASTASDPMQLTRLVNSASFAANNDQVALNDSFAGLARSKGRNDTALIDGFNKAFTSTVEKTGIAGLKTFNQAFSKVENADYSASAVSQGDNLKQFFSTATQTINAGNSEKESLSNMQRLTKGIEISENADDIYNFFNEFTGPEPKKDFA
ncbi:MAG: hypothetical protein A2W80_07470 [Candidatus Riflebacteria bacterium GWC2_50_8]|nr:MAG: hypothetical protein A2W80_07470 [Candidatus Riflebacteria bacterium GWC2_50_8]